jgi:glycoprotein endo-alpha-1,2-mannosidase
MFDEMNEGTAIFKCSQSPPSLGDGLRFVRYAEAPNFYLQLTGQLKDYIK